MQLLPLTLDLQAFCRPFFFTSHTQQAKAERTIFGWTEPIKEKHVRWQTEAGKQCFEKMEQLLGDPLRTARQLLSGARLFAASDRQRRSELGDAVGGRSSAHPGRLACRPSHQLGQFQSGKEPRFCRCLCHLRRSRLAVPLRLLAWTYHGSIVCCPPLQVHSRPSSTTFRLFNLTLFCRTTLGRDQKRILFRR